MRQVIPILLGCLLFLVATDALHGEVVSPEPVTPVLACADCNDNNACTLDSCDTTRGVCGHDLLNCDDANVCTNDQCDPESGCMHVIDSRLPRTRRSDRRLRQLPRPNNPGRIRRLLRRLYELTVSRSSVKGSGRSTDHIIIQHLRVNVQQERDGNLRD
jgi:hypothetical protein